MMSARQAEGNNGMTSTRPLSYGVAWYPEWGPQGTWRRELDRIAGAGLNTVRIGEFAWDVLEPARGRFEFDFYDEVMTELERREFQVIFGVDTVRPPEWVFKLYPDIHLVDAKGHFAPRRWPRHCFNHPAFKELSEQYIAAVIPRYRSTAAVRMYQVDNEPAYHTHGASDRWFCYCEHCQREFHQWLSRRYADKPPELSAPFPRPQEMGDLAWLEWRLFQDETVVRRTAWVIDQVKRHDPDRPATTNIMISAGFRAAASEITHDVYRLAGLLDVMGMDYYPDMRGDGNELDSLVYSVADQLSGGDGFECLETQATTFAVDAGGWSGQEAGFRNFGPQEKVGPQFWRAVGHGARSVLYWAWRLRSDNVWALTDPDGSARPAVQQVRDLADAVASIWPQIGVGCRPSAPVAIVFNRASEHLAARHGLAGLTGESLLHAFTAARRLVGTVDVIDIDADHTDLSPYGVVVVPFLYVVPRAAAEVLRRYIESGGTLLWGGRGGVCGEPDDGWTQVSIGSSMRLPSDIPLPAQLDALTGYRRRGGERFSNSGFTLGTTRVDGGGWLTTAVVADATEIRAQTSDGRPALLCSNTGKGVTWSTLVDPFGRTDAGLVELLTEVFTSAGVLVSTGAAGPDPCHEIIRRTHDNGEIVFLINGAAQPWNTEISVAAGSQAQELLTGSMSQSNNGTIAIDVPPRDARILAIGW